MGGFAFDVAEPVELGFKLGDDQRNHPDGLMMRVPDFLENVGKCLLLASKLRLEEFDAPIQLAQEDPRAGLPGKSHPGEKWRALALIGPVGAFESTGEDSETALGGSKDATLGAFGGISACDRANELEPRELVHGIVDLGPRNGGPVAHLAPFQLSIRLIA